MSRRGYSSAAIRSAASARAICSSERVTMAANRPRIRWISARRSSRIFPSGEEALDPCQVDLFEACDHKIGGVERLGRVRGGDGEAAHAGGGCRGHAVAWIFDEETLRRAPGPGGGAP